MNKNDVVDIEGVRIDVGDIVYYARKAPYSAKGLLVKRTVTKISESGNVFMDKFMSISPSEQIIIRIKVRKTKLERLIGDDENDKKDIE